MRRFTAPFLASLMLVTAACSDEGASSDEVNAKAAASVVQSSADVAYISQQLTASASAGIGIGLSVDQAKVEVIAKAEANFKLSVTAPECLAFETDKATYIKVTFNKCQTPAGLQLNGTVQADLTIETSPEVAATFKLTATDLSLGEVKTSGTWTVRAVLKLPPALSTKWDSTLEFPGPDGDLITGSTDGKGTLSVEAFNLCLLQESATAQLKVSGSTITMAAENVKVCAKGCPQSGKVTITGPNGRITTVQFDGDASATVTTPDGSFEIPVQCN